MIVRSLSYRTDLLFLRFNGEVVDRGDHLTIRTPSNPTFYWGNFLLFEAPPGPGDFDRWRALFAEEIGRPPETLHMAFGWDGNEVGDPIAPFLEEAFTLDDSVVLTAKSVVPPPKVCAEAEVRPLTQPWEWEAVLENQVAGREEIYGEAGYREYATRKIERYRAMVDAGLGHWFGAFLDGRLAGDLGLFVFEGLGRFQTFGTHPDFRRRGVCGTLVHAAANYAFERMGAETLVIVAERDHAAARIYESVGFVPVERQLGLTFRGA